MKRGFILRAEQKKAAAKRRSAQQQIQHLASSSPTTAVPGPVASQQLKGEGISQVDQENRSHIGFQISGLGVDENQKLAYGNLSEADKALPSDYDPNFNRLALVESDPTLTRHDKNTTTVTTIPQPVPDDEPQCEWVVRGSTKEKVFNTPGYPARIPKLRHPDMYEVKSTSDMAEGLFANRDIKRGDIFLAERPLLVVPHGVRPLSTGTIPDHYTPQQIQQIIAHEFESVLEFALGRSSSENQAAYKALHNAHTGDGSGPLLGIMRTNAYGIGSLYDGTDEVANYGAICKVASRINHSCMPNARYYFTLNSFSMQFYATRDIKAGKQIFCTYCSPNSDVAERQASLAPYGFACKCPACLNATPETDKLRHTFKARVESANKMSQSSSTIKKAALEDAVKLEKDMVKEGLEVEVEYLALLKAIHSAYVKSGKVEESEKYGVRVEEFKNSFRRDKSILEDKD